MTNFQAPLTGGGLPTGNQATDPRGDVLLVKQETLDFSTKTKGRTLPDNAKISRCTVVLRRAVSGIAAGLNVRIGTTANPNKYGLIAVSAVNTYTMTLSAACVSADGQIVFDATAQASAAETYDFAADVQLSYFVKSI